MIENNDATKNNINDDLIILYYIFDSFLFFFKLILIFLSKLNIHINFS